jgi:hypothetical protein
MPNEAFRALLPAQFYLGELPNSNPRWQIILALYLGAPATPDVKE